MVGALPSRIAARSTGSASPSISRKTIPGTSVLSMIPCRRAIRCAMRMRGRVLGGPEDDGQHDAHGGDDEGGQERPAEVVDLEHPVGHVGGDEEDERVGDQDQQEAEDERERQPQGGERGRDDRVQRGHDHRDQQRTPRSRRCGRPARIPPATIRATAVATHETTSGNNRQRGRSGCQSVHPPEARSGLLAITLSSCRTPSAPTLRISGASRMGRAARCRPHPNGMNRAARLSRGRGSRRRWRSPGSSRPRPKSATVLERLGHHRVGEHGQDGSCREGQDEADGARTRTLGRGRSRRAEARPEERARSRSTSTGSADLASHRWTRPAGRGDWIPAG